MTMSSVFQLVDVHFTLLHFYQFLHVCGNLSRMKQAVKYKSKKGIKTAKKDVIPARYICQKYEIVPYCV